MHREDFTRLKKVVEKKREAATRERELLKEEAIAAEVMAADDTLLDNYDAQEQGDVYF